MNTANLACGVGSEGSLVSDLVDRQLQQQMDTQELAVLVEWVLLTAISNEEAVLLALK